MTHTVTDLRFRDLIDDFAPVDRVASRFMFTEGPIWHPLGKTHFFSDMPGDLRRSLTPDGRVEEVQRPSEKPMD